MIKRLVVLALMVLYDISLHFAELIGINESYIFWLSFASREIYTLFWTAYWITAFIIILSLIGGKK